MVTNLWVKAQLPLRTALAATTMIATIVAPIAPVLAASPTTPITHVIVIIGENRTFDHVFATYTPKSTDTVNNLLSEGIVKADGTPGANFAKAAQNAATDTTAYAIAPTTKTALFDAAAALDRWRAESRVQHQPAALRQRRGRGGHRVGDQ